MNLQQTRNWGGMMAGVYFSGGLSVCYINIEIYQKLVL